MAATSVKTKVYPVSEVKRYRFLIEWACTATSSAFTVTARWYNFDKSSYADVTIISENAQTADTWQINTATLIPPSDARWVQFFFTKPNVSAKFGVSRFEFKAHDTAMSRRNMSVLFFEDFLGDMGQYTWTKTNTSADGITLGWGDSTTHTFGQWSETGIVKLTTGSGIGSAGTYHVSHLMFGGKAPAGTEFTCKVQADSTNRRCWIGLWSSTTDPDLALSNSVYGVGFRASNTGVAANWYGVCRNGTAETTVDLGVGSGTTWRTLGWARTSGGIQFLVRGRPVGSVVTTNIPGSTQSLGPLMGIGTLTSSAKVFQCDFMGLETSSNRYL